MNNKLIYTIKISITGEPNVGKSTLLNKIFKKKISSVTRKSQTTLKQKSESLIYKKKQFLFLDTPGIFGSKEKLSRATFKHASNAILDSDLVLLLVSSVKPNIDITLQILNYIKSLNKEYLIIINKIDLLHKNSYLKTIDFISRRLNKKKILSISAMSSTGINALLNYVSENYKFNFMQTLYSKNNDIDPLFIEDIVREKVLNNIHDEIPYDLIFKTENIRKNRDKSFRVDVNIFYKKNSHKPILLGKGGKNIKKISINARLDLEKKYKEKFHLFLYLKVVKKKRLKIDSLEK